ncbi:DUF2512 family protein [Salipaludibacillus aurantiacus]|uniref:4 TMS phage holin, superfamily IV n=1 Tax=Salipaludibacillus aurantiacus TaxID=1601833 RepID=A0A1H9PHN0_9BACI|nr:DUF2512 family protein [Salipaludibacillus aurantiacus]SER47732.1 Protein of unknown function [Salipaludibacillus aurantiacus]
MKVLYAVLIKWVFQISVLWLVFTFYGFSLFFLVVFGLIMSLITLGISDYVAFSFIGNLPAAIVDGIIVFLSMLIWLSLTTGLDFGIFAALLLYSSLVISGEWFIHRYVIYPVRRGGSGDRHAGYE